MMVNYYGELLVYCQRLQDGKARKTKWKRGGKMSEDMRKLVCTILSVMETVAKKSKSKIDDVVVRMLEALAGCDKNDTPEG
jgi:hypothetical protein